MSSNKYVLQEIYTSANPDFNVKTFSQNDVELNSKELLYKDNNVSFSITDEDEYNNSLELLKNDILINNIHKLMN